MVWQLRKRNEWLWLQKSRLDWALKGDKNTRFFHVMAISRQSMNMINSMKVGENILEELGEINQAAYNHFKVHFDEKWRIRTRIGGIFKKVDYNQTKELLEKDFSESEVWRAIKECDDNKAPGPYGFNMICFQKG